MSKEFRPWKIDEAQLLPPSVLDYVAKDHLSGQRWSGRIS
jgi:hypothetical protein